MLIIKALTAGNSRTDIKIKENCKEIITHRCIQDIDYTIKLEIDNILKSTLQKIKYISTLDDCSYIWLSSNTSQTIKKLKQENRKFIKETKNKE